MKKIFSAFLLMTMMVFSVGSFVSCSDIEKEIAAVDSQATENAAAIADLNSKLTALQTALTAAQADADAAMAAAQAAQKAGDDAKAQAEAAKAAAATAKAEAIAEATKLINDALASKADKTALEAVAADVKALTDALAGTAEDVDALEAQVALIETTLAEYKATLAELGLEDEALWTSVSELQEQIVNLQGSLQAQEMTLEDLKAAVDKAVADVKAINTNLVAVYNIVAALANQIQSIVYVPETTDGKATVQGYALGTAADAKKTDLLVKMTFEVSPKGLADAITPETAAMSTVTVKAADAEYFNVEVANADPATGRVVVYAHIPAKTAAYKHLTKEGEQEVALSLNVAEENMISVLFDDEPELVDAGTYVQSSYVGVKEAEQLWDNVYDNFVIYDKTAKKPIPGTSLTTVEHKVAYNKAPSVTSLFSKYEVRALIDGGYMTLADAAEFTGFEFKIKNDFKVSYGYTDNAYDPSKATENPFTVTGKDLTTTAQFAGNDKVSGDKLIGAYLKAAVGTFTVNNQPIPGTIEATYKVVEKKADFEIETIEHAWTHSQCDEASIEPYELAVTGFDKLTPNQNLGEFTATWKVGDVTKKAYTTVTALSSKAVIFSEITGNKLTFAQGKEATYTFKRTVTIGNTSYDVAFDVVLGAMPENDTIDLGTFEVYGSTTDAMVIPNTKGVDPIAEAIARISQFDSKVNIKDTRACFTEDAHTPDEDVDGVTEGYDADIKVGISYDTEDEVYYESSYITIDPVDVYENTINIAKTYTFCGVTYTYTAKVVTKEPVLSIAPNNVYVTSEGIAPVTGTVGLNYAKDTNTAKETGKNENFTLNAIDLRNLVHVTFPEGVASTDYKLRYTLTTPMYKEDGKTQLYKDLVNADDEFQAYSSTALPVVENGVTKTTVNKLTWNTDLNELTFQIALVSAKNNVDRNEDNNVDANDDVVFGEPITVTVQIPTLVDLKGGQVEAKYVNGAETSANIVKAISVTDVFKNEVYNPYASSLFYIWKGYSATLYNGKVKEPVTIKKSEDFFNVYDMEIVTGAKKDIKVYLNGSEIAQSQVAFEFNSDKTSEDYGKLTLTKENFNLQGEIKFEIPVTLNYLYDNYGVAADKETAVVVFSADAADSNDPSLAYTNPNGYQWTFDACLNAQKVWDDEANDYVYEKDENGDYVLDQNDRKIAVMEYPRNNHYFDFGVTADKKFIWGMESDYEGMGVLAYQTFDKYEVIPADATSGVIVLYIQEWEEVELDESPWYEIVYGDYVEVARIPYTNFTGTAVTIDGTNLDLVDKKDAETSTSIINLTLVPEPVEIVSNEGIAQKN